MDTALRRQPVFFSPSAGWLCRSEKAVRKEKSRMGRKKKYAKLSLGKKNYVQIEAGKDGGETVKKLNTEQRKFRRKNCLTSLDSLKTEKGFEPTEELDDVGYKERARLERIAALAVKVIRYLPKRERSIARALFVKGMTQADYARKHGLKRQDVSAEAKLAAKNIRKFLGYSLKRHRKTDAGKK
jgi:DNA-directed RNA polymerase specialized sigma subunit